MSFSDGLRKIGLIAEIFLLISKGAVVRGQAPGPNAVVSINGQTMLDCVAAQMANGTTWTHATDGTNNNPLTIASGCSVNSSNAAYYSTVQPGDNICRLIIENATMQQAGIYNCFNGASTTYWSLVTIIDPFAKVVVHNHPPEVVEGEQLNISCSVNYTGPSPPAPSLRPVPYFTTSPGQSFTSLIYYTSENTVTVVATVRVQKPTVPIFRCNTVFDVTGNDSRYNETPPADNITLGVTTELDVQCTYPPDYECQPKSIIVIIVAAVLAYLVGNFIATVIFLSCYNQNIGFRRKMNARFSWLLKMLHCMNENVSCRCHWICLSILVFTLFGILFTSSILVVEKCSRKPRRSEASFQQFQKGSGITDGGDNVEMENTQGRAIGPNGDETYAQIDAVMLSQDNSRKVRDRKKQQNGEENEKSVNKKKNSSRPFDGVGNPGGNISNPMFDNPTSSPLNPQNESAQLQQPNTAPGTVYSDLPVISLNIQPEQYLEGNKDIPTYSELNKA